MTEDEFEPARRELCPDGTCVGLIGPDGRCKVCGAVGASAVADPRVRGMRLPGGEEEAEEELESDRDLCPDGACVGIIGPDGRCKVCGAARGPDAGSWTRDSTPGDLAADSEAGDDDEDRELCLDGSCLGLIGADGRCKICGTSRSSEAS